MRRVKELSKHVIRHGKTHIANMWLDDYNDIFSDFDPSPYSHRMISDDFISEAKKIFDKKNHVKEFNLYVQEHLRNNEEEEIIKKRLHGFFKENLQRYDAEFRQVRKKGFIFAFSGILLLTIITYLLSIKTFLGILQYIFIIAEPAGWFLIWMGFDYIFFTNKPKKPVREFYKKLSDADIFFHSTPEC